MYAFSEGMLPTITMPFLNSELKMLVHIFSRQLWKLATLS